MSSLLHRGLHATTGAPPRGCWGHIEIPLVSKDAPAWVTSLVEWLGMHKMELHLSGSVYSWVCLSSETSRLWRCRENTGRRASRQYRSYQRPRRMSC